MAKGRKPLYVGGIFRRQFFALFCSSLLFSGFACIAIVRGTEKTIIARQLELSAAYRDEARSRLADWFSERLDDMEYLARMLESEGVSDTSTVSRRLALFGSIETVYREVLLIAPDGRVVASKSGVPDASTSVMDRDYFKKASRGGRGVSGIIRGKLTGSAEIAVSVPFRQSMPGESSGPSGVVAGIVPLEMLSAVIGDLNLEGLGRVYLVDESGCIVSSPDYPKLYKELGPEAAGVGIDNYATRELRAGRRGAGEYRGYGGIEVIGAFERIDDLDLGLAVELSRERALGPVSSLVPSGIVFTVSMFLVLTLAAFLLSARLVAPIRALVSAADSLIRDQAMEPISLRTGTELDQLISFFNLMAATVREREEGLKESAARDSLTGLYNHARIEEFLDLEIKRKRRSGEELAFVMLDIDFFKRVNDDYGHLAGDEILRGIARLLEDSVRGGDIAGRYGGEEFSVILDAGSDEEVLVFCERIRERVEGSVFVSEGKSIRVTVSLGWTRIPVEGLGPYDIVRSADRALYFAKERGRNRVCGAEDDRRGAG
jgi:diguanylate cyclase (GGDEF)-like protein